MAVPDPSADPAVAPAPDGARRFPWSLEPWNTVVIILRLTGDLVLRVRRIHDDHSKAAHGVLFQLIVLAPGYYTIRWYELSRPGSVARGRVRLAVWRLITTIMVDITWKFGKTLPRGLAIPLWVVTTAAEVSAT